ncbi:MAG: hypothetical protein IPM29_02085 [Planctomycetes bacterium]|nr:hypothetical protein [Planctomycetota bacterium]
MRLQPAILAFTVALGTAASAQNVINEYVIYPGSLGRYYDRGNLGVSQGEVLQGYHKSTLAGLGDDGSAARIESIVTPIADFRNNTQETYDVVVRGGSDAAGPDLTVAPLGEVLGLNTPLLTNGNRTAWYLNARLSVPIPIPQNDFFTVGLRFEAEPTWPNDGNAVMVSPMASHGSGMQQEDQVWNVVGDASNGNAGGAVVSQPIGRVSYHMRVGTSQPVFQLGVDDLGTLRFGYGGMFPQSGVSTLAAMVQHRSAAAAGQGRAFILAAMPIWTLSLPIPGINNRLWLNPTVLIPLGSFPLAASDGIGSVSLFPIPPVLPGATVGFQALTTDGASFWLTNAQNCRM